MDGAVLVIGGPIADGDLGALSARLRSLAAAGATEVVCDVRALAPDARSVDALARQARTARRNGCRLRLRDPSRELLQLLAFCGLAALRSGLEAQREPEEGEHPLRVEERVDRRDATV
jgi:hypothetical protein